jgi:hypothetical protein
MKSIVQIQFTEKELMALERSMAYILRDQAEPLGTLNSICLKIDEAKTRLAHKKEAIKNGYVEEGVKTE